MVFSEGRILFWEYDQKGRRNWILIRQVQQPSRTLSGMFYGDENVVRYGKESPLSDTGNPDAVQLHTGGRDRDTKAFLNTY